MSISPHGSQKSFTAEEVQEWLHTAQRKHLELHALATAFPQSPECAVAVTHMSALFEDALEEVRVISASLREESQTVRQQVKDIREYAKHLAPVQPTPEEIRDAESRFLAMFKGDIPPGKL